MPGCIPIATVSAIGGGCVRVALVRATMPWFEAATPYTYGHAEIETARIAGSSLTSPGAEISANVARTRRARGPSLKQNVQILRAWCNTDGAHFCDYLLE